MPATGVRCTMTISDERPGLSETHVYLGSTDITAAYPFFVQLFKKRLQICGAGIVPEGGRLSVLGDPRNSRPVDLRDVADAVPGPTTYNIGRSQKENNDPDQANACIKCRKFAGTRDSGALYLGGVPDAVIRFGNEGNAIALVPGFGALLDNYFAELKSGRWGMVVRVRPSNINPATLVVDTTVEAGTNLVGIITVGAIPNVAPGGFVVLSGFKRTNVAFRSLNGSWQVKSQTNAATPGQVIYTLRGTAGIDPNTITRNGTAFVRDFVTAAYTEIKPVGKTTRKRGVRFSGPLGRRSVRKPVSL